MPQKIDVVNNDKNEYSKLLFVFVFLIGLLNSQRHFYFAGLNNIYSAFLILFYLLLGSFVMIAFINVLINRKGTSPQYWIVLFFAVLFKFFILFIQSPSKFAPTQEYFVELFTFLCSFGILISIIVLVKNMRQVKALIWALGVSCGLSAAIPLIFFPEMIGTRVSDYNGYFFSGSFWNASVISYMSVAWLLIAITAKETMKIKKSLLIGMFLLLILGSLAGLSRAALVSIIVSLIVYLIASNKFTKYLKVIVSIIILSVILFNLFQEPINNFVLRMEGGIEIEEEPRMYIWLDYIEDLPDYFLFGELSGDYLKYSETRHGPHSVFLNWFTQFGVFGFIGFIILLYGFITSIKIIKRNYSKDAAASLYAWLAAYLSVAVINETGFIHYSLFCAFGIVLAWGKVIKKGNETN